MSRSSRARVKPISPRRAARSHTLRSSALIRSLTLALWAHTVDVRPDIGRPNTAVSLARGLGVLVVVSVVSVVPVALAAYSFGSAGTGGGTDGGAGLVADGGTVLVIVLPVALSLSVSTELYDQYYVCTSHCKCDYEETIRDGRTP